MSCVLKTGLILTSRKEEVIMPIGEKIQALRTMKSWSQDDLAKKLGTKAPNISRWENNRGTPSAEALRELAKIFDVSADYLLFDETPLRPLVAFRDAELLDQFTQIDRLDETARAALKRVIRAMVAERQIKEMARESA